MSHTFRKEKDPRKTLGIEFPNFLEIKVGTLMRAKRTFGIRAVSSNFPDTYKEGSVKIRKGIYALITDVTIPWGEKGVLITFSFLHGQKTFLENLRNRMATGERMPYYTEHRIIGATERQIKNRFDIIKVGLPSIPGKSFNFKRGISL